MRLKRVWIPLALLVAIVLGLALFTNIFGRPLIPGLPFAEVRTIERFATSSITLESMHELYAFATVRYVHRAVFPYDYLPAGVSLNEVLETRRTSEGLTEDVLTEEEYLYWSTYQLAESINLSRPRNQYDFVVVTLLITAGFEESTGAEEIVIERVPGADGEILRRAVVTLAPPTIIETAVEDIDPDDYPYPDTPLGAEAWRRVAEYVREQSVPQEIIDDLLSHARRNGEEFVRGVLMQAGFSQVVFENRE